MTQARKFCLYKGCDNIGGRTLFKFPVEKERFCVWAQNAGLELKGDVNLSEYRYLCDKHFSTKYISNQSRRKMLVHTAVPEKWHEEAAVSEPEFTIVGQKPKKKRKSQFSSRESLDTPINTQPTIILNSQKRKADDSNSLSDETIEMIDSEDCGQLSNHDIVYEKMIIPPNSKRSYKCVVVKQKKVKSPTNTIINYIQPSMSSDEVKEETFFLTEEGNISSTNVDQKDDQEEEMTEMTTMNELKKSAPVESYSEFIFNGEIYVQMPKRVFEAEKEKIYGESLKYKAMLLKMRKQIDDLLEN